VVVLVLHLVLNLAGGRVEAGVAASASAGLPTKRAEAAQHLSRTFSKLVYKCLQFFFK
jgi:hypothetical protein